MKAFILSMHGDATDRAAANDDRLWAEYLARLRGRGHFDGGSSIGVGLRLKKGHAEQPCSAEPSGFLRVRADDLEAARRFLVGNPVWEAGGTVELRELPADA